MKNQWPCRASSKVSLFSMLLISISTLGGLTSCDSKHAEPPPPVSTSAVKPAQVDGVAAAQAAVNQAPSYEHVITLGLELEKANRLDEALASYQKAAAMNPKAPVAFNNMCSVQTSLGRYTDAITSCNQALANDGNFQLAKNNLKVAVVKEDEAKKFLIAHKTEFLAATNMTSAQILNRGMDYYSVKEYASAIEFWSKIKAGDPLYASAQNDIATAYIILKNYDGADRALSTAEKLDPKNQLFANNRKWLEGDRGGAKSPTQKSKRH